MVYIVDGGWSEWKEISGCPATCGEDIIKVQIRSCSEPPSSCGGKYCEGPDLQFIPCNVSACCPGLLLKCIITSKNYFKSIYCSVCGNHDILSCSYVRMYVHYYIHNF